MTITVNTKAYNADIPSSKDSVPVLGPNHTLSVTDKFDLYRTAPKATKEFSGTARSRVKLSRTTTLTGALTTTGLMIGDVNFSIPVGAAAADVDALCADLGAAIIQTWAKELAKNLDLTV